MYPYDLNETALARILARPRPEEWDPDEPLTLYEAVALLFPMGPVVVRTLRTARAQGLLDTALVAGRIYTTVAAVRAMTRPAPLPDPVPPPHRPAAAAAPPSHPRLPEQEAFLDALASRRRRAF